MRKETIQGKKLFKGKNYSREETINFYEGLTEETIQRRKLFKGGNYMRKYGKHLFEINWPLVLRFSILEFGIP